MGKARFTPFTKRDFVIRIFNSVHPTFSILSNSSQFDLQIMKPLCPRSEYKWLTLSWMYNECIHESLKLCFLQLFVSLLNRGHCWDGQPVRSCKLLMTQVNPMAQTFPSLRTTSFLWNVFPSLLCMFSICTFIPGTRDTTVIGPLLEMSNM